jgi:hypothetical protein
MAFGDIGRDAVEVRVPLAVQGGAGEELAPDPSARRGKAPGRKSAKKYYSRRLKSSFQKTPETVASDSRARRDHLNGHVGHHANEGKHCNAKLLDRMCRTTRLTPNGGPFSFHRIGVEARTRRARYRSVELGESRTLARSMVDDDEPTEPCGTPMLIEIASRRLVGCLGVVRSRGSPQGLPPFERDRLRGRSSGPARSERHFRVQNGRTN